MGRFLYFIPGVTHDVTTPGAYRKLCEDAGLGELLKGTGVSARLCTGGPDKGEIGGVVMCPQEADGGAAPVVKVRCGYFPDEQRWVRGPDGAYWLGYYLEDRPRPETLRRGGMLLEGHAVLLADGQEWRIPIARYLPKIFGVDDQGSDIARVRPDCRVFFEAASEFTELARSGAKEIPYELMMRTAISGFALNYRIGELELRALEVIDTDNVFQVCWAAIDGPTVDAVVADVEAAAKKNEIAATRDTSAGDSGNAA